MHIYFNKTVVEYFILKLNITFGNSGGMAEVGNNVHAPHTSKKYIRPPRVYKKGCDWKSWKKKHSATEADINV